jgi:hypothetical protein
MNPTGIVEIPRTPQTPRCVVDISADPLCWIVQKHIIQAMQRKGAVHGMLSSICFCWRCVTTRECKSFDIHNSRNPFSSLQTKGTVISWTVLVQVWRNQEFSDFLFMVPQSKVKLKSKFWPKDSNHDKSNIPWVWSWRTSDFLSQELRTIETMKNPCFKPGILVHALHIWPQDLQDFVENCVI